MNAAPSIDRLLEPVKGRSKGSETAVAAVVKEYVAAVRDHLRVLHRGGASGKEVNETHSDLMDRLVRRLFNFAEEGYFSAEGEEDPSDLCVVAVGGYARREMNVHSDVDLLFLYRNKLTPHVAAVAERIQYWLWDAALTVGGATRTIAETIALARRDDTVKTSVMGTRFLVGSGVLFHEFSNAVSADLLARPEPFMESQVAALEQRHTQFGNSLYLLQPNLKDGAGGLRDYHVAYWVMQASQPNARGREDFLHLGLLTEEEVPRLNAALDFLWRVRNELHLITGRKSDQMGFDLQERVAQAFGYTDGDTEDLPVERFMGDYYRQARCVRNFSSLIIEQCRARVRGKPRRRKVRELPNGFRVADGRLEIPRTRQLRERPVRLLEAFAASQREDLPLTRKAQRLLRENLDLIDEAYRTSEEARQIFLGILDSPRRVTRALMGMNEIGLLGAFLPEWEHIVCRWQHVMYHTYTVDVHSIFLIEELRRLWLGQYQAEFPELTEMMREVDDRPLLYLGCLLHDIGKGFGGDHSNRGAVRSKDCLERLGLAPDRIDRVIFLVRHHLRMSHLAQRRDLSDPRLILEFARVVGDRTNLRYLYLLTFADIRASSSSAWSDWKGQLLRELFERTSEFLETGSDDPDKAIELIERRVEKRREGAHAELLAVGVPPEEIDAYFEMMPRRYFTAHGPRQIARHAQVVLKPAPDGLVSTSVREMRGGFSELILCAKDVHGLFGNVAGTLTAHGINVLGAHVYTTRSGLALEVYRVTTPKGGDDERRMLWDQFERSLESVLAGRVGVAELLLRRGRPVGATSAPLSKPVTVSISNDESDFYTIVDITANDRLGLLHDLTRTIAEHNCEIYISKAATILDQVTDTFYVKDAEGKKIHDPSVIRSLRRVLLRAAEGENGD